MNTLARQSISKTFVKACTAAVLLVTCLNTQAADSNVNEQFENFRTETMTSIQADLKTSDLAAPSLDALSAAIENSAQSNRFRAETLTSIQADLQASDFAAPNLDEFSAAVESSLESNDLRAETLTSINAERHNSSVAPSLDLLNAALENTQYPAETDTLQAEQVNTVWMDTENILPAIASLGSIEYEVKDTASREATMLALNFAINALEYAKTNLAVSQPLTL